MSQHTPGPWRYTPEDDGFDVYVSVGPHYANIAYACRQPVVMAEWDAEANARLIAAAPELLEALKAGSCPCWVHNAAITSDIEALRRIAIWHQKWNNEIRLPSLAKAEGRAE